MYYAEFQTDKFVRENFFPDLSYKGIMVEVGAGPPEFISMSKHFRDNGWRCICIEPNPKFVEQHRNLGNEIFENACSFENKESNFYIVDTTWEDESVNGISMSALEIRQTGNHKEKRHEIQIKVRTLNSILEELNIEKIDFLSVDTEGWEIEVMKGFSLEKYEPKIVLLESFNPKIYNEYMNNNGYQLMKQIHFNYIYKKN